MDAIEDDEEIRVEIGANGMLYVMDSAVKLATSVASVVAGLYLI
jgi:hypothetical protein